MEDSEIPHGSRRDWVEFWTDHSNCGGDWIYIKDPDMPRVICSCVIEGTESLNAAMRLIAERDAEIVRLRKIVTQYQTDRLGAGEMSINRARLGLLSVGFPESTMVCMGNPTHHWLKYSLADGSPLCHWPCLRCGKVRRGKHPGH